MLAFRLGHDARLDRSYYRDSNEGVIGLVMELKARGLRRKNLFVGMYSQS